MQYYADYWDAEKVNTSSLEGETISKIEGLEKQSDKVTFHLESGKIISFIHIQDCCENVYLEDFDASCDDFSGALITKAEEVSCESGEEEYGTYTWTFYKVETSKGGIFMRFYGSSNGYYSESVNVIWENANVN